MILRPATADDRERLLALVRDERVAAALSTVAGAALDDAIAAGEALVIADGDAVAGVLCWSVTNRRSRIARIHTVAVDPALQGRGLAVSALRAAVRTLVDEHDVHRVEAECYGFNTAARRAFAAAGFAEEGVRRSAYDRHGAWQDGIHLGLVAPS
jgi:RimJ/RimL family protein N-acetyltransferase